jgi:hypothetical protein
MVLAVIYRAEEMGHQVQESARGTRPPRPWCRGRIADAMAAQAGHVARTAAPC